MNPNEQQQRQQQQHTTTRRTAIFILFVLTMASRIITSFAFRPSLQSSTSSTTTAALLTRRTMTMTSTAASSASSLSLPDFGSPKFGITKTLTDTSFDEAVDRVQAQLKTVGFGVITKIVRTKETNEFHHDNDYSVA
jgi:hypothetical protein